MPWLRPLVFRPCFLAFYLPRGENISSFLLPQGRLDLLRCFLWEFPGATEDLWVYVIRRASYSALCWSTQS